VTYRLNFEFLARRLNAARHLITLPIGRKFLPSRATAWFRLHFVFLLLLNSFTAFLFTGGLLAMHRLIVSAQWTNSISGLLGLGRDVLHQL